jgi:hypothetical protein
MPGLGMVPRSMLMKSFVIKVHVGPRDWVSIAGNVACEPECADCCISSFSLQMNGSDVAAARKLRVTVSSDEQLATGYDDMQSKV